jgi:hypothetical protein
MKQVAESSCQQHHALRAAASLWRLASMQHPAAGVTWLTWRAHSWLFHLTLLAVITAVTGRLVALSDLQRLPMMYRARLTHSQLTHVAFSPGGSCLAAAAAEECRMALLGLRGCEQVDTLGYITTAGKFWP